MARPALLLAVFLCFVPLAWSDKLNVTGGTLFNFSCGGPAPAVMLFINDIQYLEPNVTNISIKTGEPVSAVEGCNTTTKSLIGSSAVASINVKIPGRSVTATVDFRFRRTNGRLSSKEASSSPTSFYWELIAMSVRGIFPDPKTSLCFVPEDENDWVIAPQNFSFSCHGQRRWIPLNVTRSWRTRQDLALLNGTCHNVPTNGTLKVTGLQVQAFSFGSEEVRFDGAVDCVGYITGPTAMGFVVGSMLLSILFLVSCIFLGMETPSRFA